MPIWGDWQADRENPNLPEQKPGSCNLCSKQNWPVIDGLAGILRGSFWKMKNPRGIQSSRSLQQLLCSFPSRSSTRLLKRRSDKETALKGNEHFVPLIKAWAQAWTVILCIAYPKPLCSERECSAPASWGASLSQVQGEGYKAHAFTALDTDSASTCGSSRGLGNVHLYQLLSTFWRGHCYHDALCLGIRGENPRDRLTGKKWFEGTEQA